MSNPLTTADLVRDLRESCDVKPGDVLIVHSSMKSIGAVAEGPAAVVEALQEALTPGGTLLMPTFSQIQPDLVFRMASTPSRVGLITETFRTMPGVPRSMHPTHAVSAWGRRAAEFVEGHGRTSGLGVGSPFHKASEAGAQVLMLGCGIKSCSLVHVSEAIVKVPYLGKVWYPGYDQALTLIDMGGAPHTVPPRDAPTDSSGFPIVQESLEARGQIRHCRVGEAECIKFSGQDCLAAAIEILQRDPAGLLCAKPHCKVCGPAREVLQQTAK